LNSIGQILDIISSQTGKLKNTEIAIELGVSPQVLGTWKKRGTIPYEKICEFAEIKSISLDYLLLGTSTKNDSTSLKQPGQHGELLDHILMLISVNQRLHKSENSKILNTGQLAMFIYDQIDFDAEYNEQLEFIDKIFSWYIDVVFHSNLEFNSAHVMKSQSEDCKVFIQSICEAVREESKLFCLTRNFSKSDVELIDDREFAKKRDNEYSNLLEKSIFEGSIIFDSKKPSRNIYDSIFKEYPMNPVSIFFKYARTRLREEINKLVLRRIEIKPEHMTDPNLNVWEKNGR